MNNLEYLVDPDAAIKNYFSSRNVLYILLAMNTLLELLVTYYVMRHEAIILDELQKIYKLWDVQSFRNGFEMVTVMNTVFNSMLFAYGFYAVFSHRVTCYQLFLTLLLVSVFFEVLCAYINVFNILLFIFKCFSYIYSRHVLSQLFTVLIIPNDQTLPEATSEHSEDSPRRVRTDYVVRYQSDYDHFYPRPPMDFGL